MSDINYGRLVAELIKPLVTHPGEVETTVTSINDNTYQIKVEVHPDDLGRVIGRKGRVANAIRTIAFAAATRDQKRLEIQFDTEALIEE